MKNPWKIISSSVTYQNPWMTIREDTVIRPDGAPGLYAVVETNDSVIVGALNAAQELYLIHTYSYPGECWHWELPGGGGDKEDTIVASQRELYEETGIRADTWTALSPTRPFDGLSTEVMATLLAEDLHLEVRPQTEDDAIIQDGKFFSFAEIEKMIVDGQITEGQTITALYLIEKELMRRSKS